MISSQPLSLLLNFIYCYVVAYVNIKIIQFSFELTVVCLYACFISFIALTSNEVELGKQLVNKQSVSGKNITKFLVYFFV